MEALGNCHLTRQSSNEGRQTATHPVSGVMLDKREERQRMSEGADRAAAFHLHIRQSARHGIHSADKEKALPFLPWDCLCFAFDPKVPLHTQARCNTVVAAATPKQTHIKRYNLPPRSLSTRCSVDSFWML
jgi:hypothetical protein